MPEPPKYKGLRVTPEAYDTFAEYLLGLEMSKSPKARLTLQTRASDALMELLNQPHAKEIRAKAPKRTHVL